MDTRVGSYVWIVQDDRVLLTHFRSGHPRAAAGWTLPGGGMEPGEQVTQTALREVAEETGYVAELDELLGFNSLHRSAADNWLGTGRPYHFLQIIHRAHIVGGSFEVEIDGSTDDAGWFTRDELADLDRVSLTDAALRLAGWS
ncbi:NUDIX hydrolase [Microlunatus sp. Y2014]|uniref:NUDIX hydrolase n=1 Tax=Microlunatus sp. Y2014 TaxID=3418488 RepID=UPI003DA77615